MSYYATANADIGFAEKLSAEQIKSIESNLGKVFENIRFNPDEVLISESRENYDEMAVKEVLTNITNIAKPLKGSQVSFRGEDDNLWRFVYNGEDWLEQTGDVIYRKYDKPTYEQLMDMFISMYLRMQTAQEIQVISKTCLMHVDVMLTCEKLLDSTLKTKRRTIDELYYRKHYRNQAGG